ncbi:SDR family NAD(P)-dependent oxidoreductase [Kytococcus sedentarius]|uniref:SDR family NAD(P)-dependent oxidoreductase n=1 Tax=Kytococcus sedentarius TaxID=1276 RepID=UPI0035BC8A31
MQRPLHDTTVLVTGAGSGIGRLLALGAAARGARVVLWDLDGPAADAVASEITAAGPTASGLTSSEEGDVRALAQTVDVTDADAVRAAAREAEATLGPVDVVVNNAGVVTGERLTEATDEQIRRTYEVNALAPYWVTRAVLPGMLERRRGLVVTIASLAGMVGVSQQTDYSGSKHAAVGFTDSLRNELHELGSPVGTLLVCPYYISTGMFEGVTSRFSAVLPILEPEDVARRVLDAMESGRERLVLPGHVVPALAARALPVRVGDAALRLMGVQESMRGFTGRR